MVWPPGHHEELITTAPIPRTVHPSGVADNLAHLQDIDNIAHALAAHTIATYGTAEDRERVIGHLKQWFWRAELFPSE